MDEPLFSSRRESFLGMALPTRSSESHRRQHIVQGEFGMLGRGIWCSVVCVMVLGIGYWCKQNWESVGV